MATVGFDIEYSLPNGETEYLEDVEFEGTVEKMDDGIGPYEFWGSVGYDSKPYWGCQDIDWDRALFTESENRIIGEWLSINYDKVEEALVKEAGEG